MARSSLLGKVRRVVTRVGIPAAGTVIRGTVLALDALDRLARSRTQPRARPTPRFRGISLEPVLSPPRTAPRRASAPAPRRAERRPKAHVKRGQKHRHGH